eukprot:scaffold275356_cov37-Prasinocladus_malaysianus.AAC.1
MYGKLQYWYAILKPQEFNHTDDGKMQEPEHDKGSIVPPQGITKDNLAKPETDFEPSLALQDALMPSDAATVDDASAADDYDYDYNAKNNVPKTALQLSNDTAATCEANTLTSPATKAMYIEQRRSSFEPGELVWAKIRGWSWFPGQVFLATDFNREPEKYERIRAEEVRLREEQKKPRKPVGRAKTALPPGELHLVVFFGDATWGWIEHHNMRALSSVNPTSDPVYPSALAQSRKN